MSNTFNLSLLQSPVPLPGDLQRKVVVVMGSCFFLCVCVCVCVCMCVCVCVCGETDSATPDVRERAAAATAAANMSGRKSLLSRWHLITALNEVAMVFGVVCA